MKTPSRLINYSLHTRILGGILIVIVIAAIIMIVRQATGNTINQHRDTTVVSFTSTTGLEVSTLKAQIADTPYKHAYGLMFRDQMTKEEGMIFAFTGEEVRSFWMKNTLIPLDMMFVDAKGEIVSIHQGAIPGDESGISSIYPVQYVVEVNSGRVNEGGIQTGMFINYPSLGQ